MSTVGFEVLVQLVIAAITTEPCLSANVPLSVVTSLAAASAPGAAWPPSLTQLDTASASAPHFSPSMAASDLRHDGFATDSGTRSCGRFGPASDGTTEPS